MYPQKATFESMHFLTYLNDSEMIAGESKNVIIFFIEIKLYHNLVKRRIGLSPSVEITASYFCCSYSE